MFNFHLSMEGNGEFGIDEVLREIRIQFVYRRILIQSVYSDKKIYANVFKSFVKDEIEKRRIFPVVEQQ